MFEQSEPFQAVERTCERHQPRSLPNARSIDVRAAKRAFTTRRASFGTSVTVVADRRPTTGDLVVARVVSLGQHPKLECPMGRRAQLYKGDLIVVSYGDRYAPDQFEAVVPDDLGPCDLVASGGVAARVISRHAKIRPATEIAPLGLIACRSGESLNLASFALPSRDLTEKRPSVIAVAGTSMNAGKTTTAAGLIHGIARAGLRVAAAKVTGTGSGNDYWSMLDAGAERVLDFTDMGHASTAGLAQEEVERTAISLIAHAAEERPDVIVLELADGLLQAETAGLLSSDRFRASIDGLLFAAADAMGAFAGRQWLVDRGHRVIGVSGLVTASPLSRREAAEAIGEPLIGVEELRDPLTAPTLAFPSRTGLRTLRVCA